MKLPDDCDGWINGDCDECPGRRGCPLLVIGPRQGPQEQPANPDDLDRLLNNIHPDQRCDLCNQPASVLAAHWSPATRGPFAPADQWVCNTCRPDLHDLSRWLR